MLGRKKKSENTVSAGATLGKLVRYMRPHLALIVVALLAAVFSAVLNLVGPSYAAKAANILEAGLTGAVDFDALIVVALVEVGVYGGAAALGWLQGYLMTTVTQKLTNRMRRDISCKINKLPLKYFDDTAHGDTLSRVTNDVDTVGQSINQSVITLITSTIMLVGSVIIMFITSPILAGSAIGTTVIGFLLMAFVMAKSQKYFTAQQAALGEVDGHIEEVFSGQLVVKAFGAERATGKKFGQINGSLYNSAYKAQFMSSVLGPIMTFVGNLGYVTVWVIGGVLVVSNGMEIGIILAFTLYVRLFSQPLSQLAQVMTQLQPATAAAARVFEFLDGEELTPESDTARDKLAGGKVKGDVEFKHVRFAYDGGRNVIRDFSASVKAGQKVAIVGPTGAGKTTLVNLLMRFYELDSGEITIDGVPITELTREAVHSMFGMVLQDTWLFKGTLKENVVYSMQNVSDEQVERACKRAGLNRYISSLPDGYDTVIDENMSVSAGQKQLITIARAMVEDAPMLILDEATSSVDTRTELDIQKAMDKLTKGRTSFVIAHRLSTVRNADLIFVMDEGDIVESGTHDELLENKGLYYDIYTSQFSVAA
ncbi:MAG: ABC transporter ATP-binding protein [Clostridiales bacterium]|nr:ABC transporter ATP-binding protein [Clostridiales bacterium]